LIDVLTQLVPYVGYPRTLNALRVLDEVTAPAGNARGTTSPGEDP
jgi:4-carboxymuconolactone decarboxylase